MHPIGIYGGTFDPVHYGHLRTVEEVCQNVKLARLYFVPTAVPPHRPVPATSADHRLAMLELAIGDNALFAIDMGELDGSGPSYTINTLRRMRAKYGDRPLCLLVGSDAFADIEQWHQWDQLLAFAHIVVMQRSGYRLVLPSWAIAVEVHDPSLLAARVQGAVYVQAVAPQAMSATAIRKIIADGGAPTDMLPPAVWDYIVEHGLYQKAAYMDSR